MACWRGQASAGKELAACMYYVAPEVRRPAADPVSSYCPFDGLKQAPKRGVAFSAKVGMIVLGVWHARLVKGKLVRADAPDSAFPRQVL
jgi:hypothetical protein